LQEEYGWHVKVISPSMNLWQKIFFDVKKSGPVEILGTRGFPMFYRRHQGMPRYLRFFVESVSTLGNRLHQLIRNIESIPRISNHEKWIPLAINEALKLSKDYKIDLIISTCLPFETHVIASQISKLINVPWVADYRDPYSFSHTLNGLTEPKIVEFERETLLHAAACTTTSNGFSLAIAKVYSGRIIQLHNGFESINFNISKDLNKPLEILYQGSIYSNFQDISILLDALDSVYNDLPSNCESKIPLIATFGGFSTHVVKNHFDSKGREIPKWVKLQGVVSFKKAKKMQQDADLVLLLNWEDYSQPGVMQTKLYEYISCGTPIISTGGSGQDETSLVLKETNTSNHFHDSSELFSHLQNILITKTIRYSPNYTEISKYSRSRQAGVLSELLDSLI
jgi:glycosyltransferase involved in cell wall biosynthesis